MMGGADTVAGEARKALKEGDARWAVHLLSKLNDSGLAAGLLSAQLKEMLAAGVHESVLYVFPDIGRQFTVTVRNSVAEVTEGQPLTGAPAPLATLTADSLIYKQIALKMLDIPAAFMQGKIRVDGNLPALIVFMGRFQT